MDLQKSLYRVHQRVLEGEHTQQYLTGCVWVFGFLDNKTVDYEKLANDQYDQYQKCQDTPDLDFSLSSSYYIAFFPQSEMAFIPPVCFYRDSILSRTFEDIFVSFETTVINQIINTFKYNDIYLKNKQTNETWAWGTGDFYYYYDTPASEKFFIQIINLIRIGVGVFFMCSVTGIYIKVTIICAPIFILAMVGCLSRWNQNPIPATLIYRSFPWIGMYLNVQDINNRRGYSKMFIAFFLQITLFYLVYISSTILGQWTLFYQSLPKELDEQFMGFIAVIQFFSILFLRTRSALQWFPRFYMTFLFAFLYYVSFTCYGYYFQALGSVVCFTISILCLILLKFEMPALSWNHNYHYVPTIDKPRMLFFPIFNMEWFYDIPPFWTMFYPLHGRPYFSQSQMSLIDRNMPLLIQTLQNQNGPINDPIIQIMPENNQNNNQDPVAAPAALGQNNNVNLLNHIPPPNNNNNNNVHNHNQNNNIIIQNVPAANSINLLEPRQNAASFNINNDIINFDDNIKVEDFNPRDKPQNNGNIDLELSNIQHLHQQLNEEE